MAAAYGLMLLLVLCCCSNLVSAKEFEDLRRANSWSYEYVINHTIRIPKDENGKALSYPGCGFRTRKDQGNSTVGSRSGKFEKLVGGVESEKNSWPWMVAIFNTGKYDWNTPRADVHCGASLISRKYALTAAHCFEDADRMIDTDPSKKSVVVGVHNITEGTKYPVRRILTHPDYRNKTYHNDIALIEFEKPVKLSKIVYPVCLPSTELTDMIEANRSEVVATGWGFTTPDGVSSLVLQEIEVLPIPFKRCILFYGNPIKGQICADGTANGKDTCIGDSGGPLVYELEDNSYVQVGIVSYGTNCSTYGWPSVYTRVSEYTKWIYDNSDLGK